MNLFTIGYEGRTADDLPASVAASGVTTVIDVRDLPLSRKRGFSKTALASLLAQSGVHYVHERGLGNPKPLRDHVKSGGDWGWFAQVFRERLVVAGEMTTSRRDSVNSRTTLSPMRYCLQPRMLGLVTERFDLKGAE